MATRTLPHQAAARRAPPRQTTLARLAYVFIFAICFTAWVPAAVNIGGLNLRASQVLLPVVLGLLWMQRPPLTMSGKSLILVGCGLLLWGATLFWTLWQGTGADSPKAMGRVFLLGLNLLHVAAVYLLVVRSRRVREAVVSFLVSVAVLNGLLLIVAVAAALNLGFAALLLADQNAPLLVDGEIVAGTVARFTFGGVTAGSVSAAALVVCLSWMLDRRGPRPRGFGLIVLLVGMGLILGFSRQGVVSLAAGLALVGAILVWRGQFSRVIKVSVIALLVAAVALLGLSLAPGGQPFIQAFAGRVALLFRPEAYTTGTVYGRTAMWAGMWEDVRQNPFVGQGQDTYLRYMVNVGEEGSHNFPLEVIHTAGLGGFIPYAVLHAVILSAAGLFVLRRSTRHPFYWLVLGLLGANVATVLASATNLVFWNPVYWMLLGLLAAATTLSRRQAEREGARRGRG